MVILNRRGMLAGLAATTAMAAPAGRGWAAPAADKPNNLLIMADDLGPVPYTHLNPPTKKEGEEPMDAVHLKNKKLEG